MLNAHSGIVTADELQVFGSSIFHDVVQAEARSEPNIIKLLHASENDILQRARQKFLRQVEGALQESIGTRFLLNKNPDLTFLLPGLIRIFPKASFLFALRDPRDVVFSCFAKDLPINPTSVEFFSLESTALKYSMAMDIWLKFRDIIAQRWIELRYEDLVTNFESHARRLIDFYGLEWEPAVSDFQSHSEARKVKSPTYEAVTKPLYSTSIGRWRNFKDQLRTAMNQLEPYIEKFGYET